MENPFIISTFQFRNTSNKFEIYGGLKGSVSLVDYYAEISNARVENLMMFVNDTNLVLQNQFTAVYDDVKLTRISLGITVSKINNFSFSIKGSTYLFATDREEKAWQLPSSQISLLARYSFLKKYSVTGEFYWFGKRYARTYEDGLAVATEMAGGLDLNLGFSYQVTDNLEVFIKARNLTGNLYQKWYNYPVQGFQMMLGVSYSF